MELSVQNNGSSVDITIKGIIKSADDSAEIKSAITRSNVTRINIYVFDSFVITSSVIGALLKFVQKDGMNINLYVKNSELYDLLNKLNLISLLNVSRY